MPSQAFGDKDSLGGSGPVSSTSLKEATDDEHPAAALRDGSGPSPHSHVLSVQHSVREPIPEFAQRPEEGAKVPSSVRGQNTGDIFPDNPPRSEPSSDCQVGEHEVAAWVFESLSQSCDAEGLAGSSAHENIN